MKCGKKHGISLAKNLWAGGTQRESDRERETKKKQRTAGNFMKIMTIIVIKSKMLSNCLINLLCKLCGKQGRGRHKGRTSLELHVSGGRRGRGSGGNTGGQFRVGRRNFTISIKTSTI